ncbi:protein SGT1 homolog [Mizuhopecten yessoensis]|uniref:protein SGT1 homolog n=1 Tax=Mizuhopecten yessoensis TaxID=6573 RepID=UPI000B45A6B2|nr:protein SGT1 homolog [Mizuhopecten yessoensis]
MAAELLGRGNDEFVNENYQKALELYTEAISVEPDKDEAYSHRAQAYIKLEQFKDAERDSGKAIELNPKNSRAFFRKGTALFHQEKYAAAKECLQIGLSLNNVDSSMKTLLQKCEAEIDLCMSEQSQGSSKISIGTSSVSPSTELGVNKAAPKDEAGPTVTSSSNSSSAITMPTGPRTRYDWYQTETMVIITVMIKKVQKEDCHIDINEQSVSVCIKLPTGTDYTLELDLAHKVLPEKSMYKIMSTKVEIKLKKAEGVRWTMLEDDGTTSVIKQATVPMDTQPESDQANRYPSSSHYTRDWDKVVTNITKEEKDENLEGDAALNNLFQKIYGDGSDETKKAMMKSFYESGGTVLSTNWKEVGEDKVEVKPPDGMEYKTWET